MAVPLFFNGEGSTAWPSGIASLWHLPLTFQSAANEIPAVSGQRRPGSDTYKQRRDRKMEEKICSSLTKFNSPFSWRRIHVSCTETLLAIFFTALWLEWHVQESSFETNLNTLRTNSFSSSTFFFTSWGDTWRCCCLAMVTGLESLLCLLSVPCVALSEEQSFYHVFIMWRPLNSYWKAAYCVCCHKRGMKSHILRHDDNHLKFYIL